jgi:hypothetical protein
LAAVSVWPSRRLPDTVGAAVLAGGVPVTGAVAAEVADATPSGFVAVTTTRIAAPTSAAISVYVAPVAGRFTHSAPVASQRCQRCV